MLANLFLDVLQGSLAVSRGPSDEGFRDCTQGKVNILHWHAKGTTHLELLLKPFVPLHVHLQDMVPEAGNTDWFCSISHCREKPT